MDKPIGPQVSRRDLIKLGGMAAVAAGAAGSGLGLLDPGKAEAQAALQKLATKGVQITQLPSLGDGGVYMSGGGTISGATINISAIYVLKGTVFFGFSDLLLGRPAPTSDAMQAQAQTVLGRLP